MWLKKQNNYWLWKFRIQIFEWSQLSNLTSDSKQKVIHILLTNFTNLVNRSFCGYVQRESSSSWLEWSRKIHGLVELRMDPSIPRAELRFSLVFELMTKSECEFWKILWTSFRALVTSKWPQQPRLKINNLKVTPVTSKMGWLTGK